MEVAPYIRMLYDHKQYSTFVFVTEIYTIKCE